jgi:HlyD family secretion protein
MNKKKSSGALRLLALLAIVVLGGVVWAWRAGYLFSSDDTVELQGAVVRRGPLEITVTERGNLTSENSVSVKSEVEGYSTILYLIGEGTLVEPGDLIAELDTSDHVDQRVAQEISVESSSAAATKAREALEIQRIENESDIAKAQQDVEFAHLELEKYIGLEFDGLEQLQLGEVLEFLSQRKPADDEVAGNFGGGNRQQELQKFRDDILIRKEELKRAEDTLSWSRQLAEKGFVERTELEADELAFTRAGIMLEQAERALFLLEKYEHPKEWKRLQNDLEEAERQLKKANKQAVARIADYEAAKKASIVMLDLEQEKLARVQDQIRKGKIFAPVSGMIVYAREEGRRGDSSPMQEGGDVRERQELVNIPGEGGMIAEASIHESSLEKVVEGLKVLVTVDALPGREFHGHVGKVAVLPDKNSWWANPNLRLYRTEIMVDDGDADMRPGMSCSIEILAERISDTLYVPVQSVHHSGGRAKAWVKSDGEVEERDVEIGSNNGKWVAIEGGLAEGEIVLLSPPVGFEPEAAQEESHEPSKAGRAAGEQAAETGGGKPGGRQPGAGKPGGGQPGGGQAGAGQHTGRRE